MTSSPQRHRFRASVSLSAVVVATAVTCFSSTSATATTGQWGRSEAGAQGEGALASPAATKSSAMTVTVSTQPELVAAVKSARPGTTISVSAGTYYGGLHIRTSGTQQQPIVIRPAGDGPVTLTANLPMPPCNATAPDHYRTVHIYDGASYWTLSGLNIVGGVNILGDNSLIAHNWFAALMQGGAWQVRRAVPGRGSNDPAAARNAIAYIADKVDVPLVPADGIRLIDDVITRKGIHVTMGRYGEISGTRITDIACGTGPGIWFGTYSDGWSIRDNFVSRVADSTHKHYMQEGIRIDGASNYNLIDGNTVADLPTDGRAITTDQDASYNTFSNNTARNVSIGFNDQMSGWGNVWDHDVVTGYRDAGFAFRMMDSELALPSLNSSTYQATVTCNSASGTGADLRVGASKESTFRSNAFHSIELADNLRGYWGAQGNTWNGSSNPPGSWVQGNLSGC